MDTNPLEKEKSYFLKTIHFRNYLEIMDNPTKKTSEQSSLKAKYRNL